MTERTASDILDETFLEVRAKLLEVAAVLDRIDHSTAAGPGLDEPRRQQREKLEQAIRLLLDESSDRAAALQMLFSRPYEEDWRERMQL